MAWASVDVVVRSPGVSRYRAELRAAEAAGVTVTTAMAVWLEDFHDAPVLAVTGTKGKSTTATLAAAILEQHGLTVALAGNIGTPVTDLYGRPPADAYVVEVSSYQATDVTVSPRACVLTSLAPDHLDWHGGEEAYYRDKLRLITAGPPGRWPSTPPAPRRWPAPPTTPTACCSARGGGSGPSPTGRSPWTGCRWPTPAGSGCPAPTTWPTSAGRWPGPCCCSADLPSPGAVQAAVDAFDGLPSRCRTVGERDGREFVDDALASNPFATTASLGAFPGRELTVILGGADRGTDPGILLEALAARRPAPRVVVLGTAADAAARRCSTAGRPSRRPTWPVRWRWRCR